MIAEDVIKILSKNPKAEVVMFSDAEGNSCTPLDGIAEDYIYVKESSWQGQVYSPAHSAEQLCMTKEEWEEIMSMPKCFLLCPAN